MRCDLPHTLYHHTPASEKGGKRKKGRRNNAPGGVDPECLRLTREANARFEAKRRRMKEGYTADELIAGLAEKDNAK